jgi:Chromo (CHRromatin Organisation MOdifier) domain
MYRANRYKPVPTPAEEAKKRQDALLLETFIVERIVGKRRRKGRTEYHIKWEGYESDKNTWEPETNIFDKRLIVSFEQQSVDSVVKVDDDGDNDDESKLRNECAS